MLIFDLPVVIIDVRRSWLKEDKKGSNSGEAGGEQRPVEWVVLGLTIVIVLLSFRRQSSEQYN